MLFLQIQALPALGSSYILDGPAQVEILHKSELNTHMANCTCVYKGVQLKSNLQHNGI